MNDGPTFNVRKIGYTLPISTEVLWRNGAITDEQARELGFEPPPPPTRRQRWRWARQTWWHEHKPHLHLGPCDTEDYE